MRSLKLQTEQNLLVKLCTKQLWKELLRIQTVNTADAQSNQQLTTQTAQTHTETNGARGRGKGRRSFYRKTGENDSYDMSIAPLKIFEKQVIAIALHNLSEGFRPNIP